MGTENMGRLGRLVEQQDGNASRGSRYDPPCCRLRDERQST